MRFSSFAFLGLGFGALCLAQQQFGSLSGSVASLAGEPLKNATLQLQPQAAPRVAGGVASLPIAYAATSDAQGNFLFDQLDPGRYTLSAQRPGYLTATYSKSDGSVERIEVAASQSVTGIALKMTPQAVITGKITDQDGEPVPSAQVMAARWIYANGRKQLVSNGGGSSNFEGVYSIGDLSAGSYVVSVNVFPRAGGNVRQRGAQETVPATYFPGVTDSSSAATIAVTAGAVLRGLDIRVRKVQSYRVSGTVAGSTASTGTARLVPEGGIGGGIFAAGMNGTVRQGAFEIDGVLPGVYALEVRPAPVQGATNNEMGRQIVSVGNDNVDGVVVQMGPGAEVRGKTVYEGTPPQQQAGQPAPGASAQAMVRLMDPGGSGGSTMISNPDGTFDLQHIMPGSYQATVLPVPPGTYLKSIEYGGQDVSKSLVDLTSGSGGEMTVRLSYNVADISGVVHTSDGQPAVGITVTLWNPGMPAKDAIDFTRAARTDAHGAFHFSDMPPGEFRVAAWEQIDQGLGTVPEFRVTFETKAVEVKLNESDHAQIVAPLIPAAEIATEAAKLR